MRKTLRFTNGKYNLPIDCPTAIYQQFNFIYMNIWRLSEPVSPSALNDLMTFVAYSYYSLQLSTGKAHVKVGLSLKM